MRFERVYSRRCWDCGEENDGKSESTCAVAARRNAIAAVIAEERFRGRVPPDLVGAAWDRWCDEFLHVARFRIAEATRYTQHDYEERVEYEPMPIEGGQSPYCRLTYG